MPPKPKFTKDKITEIALQIIERDGLESLTARNLGKELGSSARPIFTVFNSMQDVTDAAIKKADDIYASYVNEGLQAPLPFKGVGMAYIRFAEERPKLFQLLFMKENCALPDTNSVLMDIETNYGKILNSICNSYGIAEDIAKKLYLHTWIYSHGIAVLIATKVCEFTTEQISQMLTDVFISLLMRAKRGEL